MRALLNKSDMDLLTVFPYVGILLLLIINTLLVLARTIVIDKPDKNKP